jgi:pimeloyl-ACP methyl ester carboxylesterase
MDLRAMVRAVVVVGVVLGTLALAPAARSTPPDGVPTGRRTLTGELGGAAYRVELPERWNGTLVLFSHGYYPEGFPSFGIAVTNRPETEAWLLEQGFALAASDFVGRTGYQVEQAQRDQIALLDWFEATVGRPHRTISYGLSMGASIAVQLGENHPDRFAGVATICGAYDSVGMYDAILDMQVVIKELLADGDPNIELVRATDPATGTALLTQAIERALTTPAGRARLALAASFHNVTGWYGAHDSRPEDRDEWIRNQAQWLANAYVFGHGPNGRADLERRAGGNPSTNEGVDYHHQLRRSSQRRVVVAAYRDAGLDLRADLDRLNASPRISADREATAWLREHGVPRGTTPQPTISLHTTGDGGAPVDDERWFAQTVRRNGDPHDLRQLWVERGAHCSTNAAEEITMLRTLVERIDTGRWPSTNPRRLDHAADQLGDAYTMVMDFGRADPVTGAPYEQPMPPDFTRFQPPRPLRPTA